MSFHFDHIFDLQKVEKTPTPEKKQEEVEEPVLGEDGEPTADETEKAKRVIHVGRIWYLWFTNIFAGKGSDKARIPRTTYS